MCRNIYIKVPLESNNADRGVFLSFVVWIIILLKISISRKHTELGELIWLHIKIPGFSGEIINTAKEVEQQYWP